MDDLHNQANKNWLEGWVYVFDYGDSRTFKIGYSITSPQYRLKQIQSGLPVIMPHCEVVMAGRTNTNCRLLEQLIHMRLDVEHVKGEWFELDFIGLVNVYQILASICGGNVELYDRWFKIIPEDYRGYIDHAAINPLMPFFNAKEYDEWVNFDWVEAINKINKIEDNNG